MPQQPPGRPAPRLPRKPVFKPPVLQRPAAQSRSEFAERAREVFSVWRRRLQTNVETTRLLRAVLMCLAGVVLALGSALADAAVHRGVESGGDTVVRHVTGRDLATNVDLTRFSGEQLPAVAAALQANGFRYVRQSFAWADIEPAPGAFVWDRYDPIVDELNRRGIVVLAVLHRSPAWARAAETVTAFDAPPLDPTAFERFAGAVAAHYGERLPYLQIWDQPNRADHWAGQQPEAGAYTGMVALASNAARAANPNVTIVLAELDPAPASGSGADDLQFLRQIYAAGAAPFFQVVAARVSGGARTPYDRRVDAATTDISRAVLFREIMIAENDGSKPVWATHFGWTAGEPSPTTVTPVNQAAYTVAGIERARSEWPWMGPLFIRGLAPGQELGGVVELGDALLDANGAPTALLTALGGFVADGGTDPAPTGLLPVGARQFAYEGNWSLQHLGEDTYRTTSEVGSRVTVQFQGTGVTARLRLSRQAAPLAVTLDGKPIPLDLEAFQSADIDLVLARGLPDQVHTLAIELVEPGQFTMGGLIVTRDIPLRWPITLLTLGGVVLLAIGLRSVLFALAEQSERLQRRRGADLLPEIGHLPRFRPARRT